MNKELYVASTPHETKVAIVEEDQLTEIYFERENEYTLAGSIYKGRVTRVLPGMQSAFVDIGLERDAFLYVTDFLEEQGDDQEEFEELPASQAPEHAPRFAEGAPAVAAAEAEAQPGPEQAPARGPEPARDGRPEPRREDESEEGGSRRWRGRRRRGRRGRGGVADSKSSRQPGGEEPPRRDFQREQPQRPPEGRRDAFQRPPDYQPIILPGESLSKYRNRAPQPPAEPPAEAPAREERLAPEPRPMPRGFEPRYSAFVIPPEEPGMAEPEPEPEPEPEIPASHEEEERSNAAAMAAGAMEEEEEVAPPAHAPEPREEAHARPAAEGRPQAAFAPGAGVMEEEEIEEEEADEAPGYGEEAEEDEFEELEEEILDSAETREPNEGNGQLTEVLRDAEAEHAFATEEGEEEEEADEREAEIAEAQRLAEGGEPQGEPGEEGEGRAQLRASASTAGYQQRAEVLPGERRRRDGGRGGRRGGRRMRGGRRNSPRSLPLISELLKEGQEILVQIAKEPMGKKGARITSHIALPGRFLVYMPTVNHVGVSRKISSDEERQRLKRILLSERQNGHGGFIVRTAAAGAGEDELRADIRFLINLWNEIRARADAGKAPALIYHDLNLVERILRDQVGANFSHIWVDSEPEYERTLRFLNRFQPALVKRVKLYSKETPLFEQFNIQEEINKALKSKVWLKSGGYIVINQTEALVAIDVNTGKYVGKTQRLEDTIVKTNVDAIKEIVRQIRLRDLGGIIIIDFIDMDERRNRQKVMQALEEALRADRAPSKVLQFNDFGLVAITRKRVKQSLERTLSTQCAYCTGTGMVKGVTTVCNEIWVEMKKMVKQLDRGDVILRVHPEVAKGLKANNARWLTDLEDLTGRTVIVKADPTLHQEQFDFH
ncbi:MAG TPA: Rne/Rng family ribonuclease [Terriglobales bacterium]|nr:Rne/Rng family ribonuclease [Terriglobales bacterium]